MHNINCVGLQCPIPIVKLSEYFKHLEVGEIVSIDADDSSFAADVTVWCDRMGHELMQLNEGSTTSAVIKKSK